LKRSLLRGLYCITDPLLTRDSAFTLVQMVAQAISGGARIIQYRDKTVTSGEALTTVRALVELCHAHDVLLLVNDDPHLALAAGADGVHLGQSDTGLQAARALLGPNKVIGITCHSDIDLALRAEQQGADYVAFGRFFTSQTKPLAPAASQAILTQLNRLSIPVAAIGGIRPDNATPLLQAGVSMLAVIHAVFGQADITAAAAGFRKLFDQPGKET